MTELEFYTEYVSHNLVHKTEYVSNNLVHETEFLDNNLKFAYEMAMEFNDQFWRELHAIRHLVVTRSILA